MEPSRNEQMLVTTLIGCLFDFRHDAYVSTLSQPGVLKLVIEELEAIGFKGETKGECRYALSEVPDEKFRIDEEKLGRVIGNTMFDRFLDLTRQGGASRTLEFIAKERLKVKEM